jgi:hypothetical protein
MKLHVIDSWSGHEAHAVRAAAECWGYAVTVTWLGTSRQLVDFFAARQRYDLLVVSLHGDEEGLILPELAPEIAREQPYGSRISATQLAEFVSPVVPVAIASGCLLGTRSFADTYVSAGFQTYIAPPDYPSASGALMYILAFLYNLTSTGGDPMASHRAADRIIPADDRFEIFSRSG